jgi:hypothetical protein
MDNCFYFSFPAVMMQHVRVLNVLRLERNWTSMLWFRGIWSNNFEQSILLWFTRIQLIFAVWCKQNKKQAKFITSSVREVQECSFKVVELEAAYNTSTVAPRVVEGNEKGIECLATLWLGKINTGTRSSRFGVWCKADDLALPPPHINLQNPTKWKPDQIWQNLLRKA